MGFCFHGQSLKCRKIVKNCSFNLMRDSLRENNFKLQRHSKDIDDSTEKLKVWCTSIEFGEICQYIHQCNKELHVIFEEIKSKKLKSLLLPFKEISENKLVVTIPPDLSLDSSECSLLGKGLGFVPTNRKPEKFQSLQDLSKFYSKIRLHAFFNNLDQTIDDTLQTGFSQEDEFTRLEKRNSTFTPREGQFEAVDKFIDKCRKDIAVAELSGPTRSNLNDNEQKALKRLRQRKDIVIKPADKGGAVVVWRKDLYQKEPEQQLSK